MEKVVIGMPIYISCPEHLYFAEQTISACSPHDVLLFINKWDSEQFPSSVLMAREGVTSVRANQDISVAGAWNELVTVGLQKAHYVLLANSDIIFHRRAVDNLVEFADAHPEYLLWTAAEWPDARTLDDIPELELEARCDEHPHFSAFMVSARAIEAVGSFDEGFQRGYLEDLDYHRRMLMLGHKAAKTASARFYHFGSRTIGCDDELYRRNAVSHAKNRAYFKAKHGYDGDGSVADIAQGFKCPFDDKTKDWREW